MVRLTVIVPTPFPGRRELTALEIDGSPPPLPARVTSRRGPFASGAVVAGKYRIERELAEGGLGIVVLAMHLELNQRVAIKYLKPSIIERQGLVDRFKREAQLAACIRSEHIVRIHDVGEAPGGGPFMVMEYLEGEDLATRLARGAVSTDEAIDYVVQACDALAEAHAMGIVHRDLKPENLFLARRKGSAPIVKILDFGLSKVNERKTVGAPRARNVTEDGERFGTPAYMSPEQLLSSGSVDARTDIWSLGVVLFELLTVEVPFEGEAIAQLAANIIHGEPTPLRAKLPDASAALEAVILKCLDKDRTRRYRNVAELVEELVRFVSPLSEPRTDRIKRIVVEGGDSIRPPRPMGPPTPYELMPVQLVMPTPPSSASVGTDRAAMTAMTAMTASSHLGAAHPGIAPASSGLEVSTGAFPSAPDATGAAADTGRIVPPQRRPPYALVAVGAGFALLLSLGVLLILAAVRRAPPSVSTSQPSVSGRIAEGLDDRGASSNAATTRTAPTSTASTTPEFAAEPVGIAPSAAAPAAAASKVTAGSAALWAAPSGTASARAIPSADAGRTQRGSNKPSGDYSEFGERR